MNKQGREGDENHHSKVYIRVFRLPKKKLKQKQKTSLVYNKIKSVRN